MPGPQPDHRPRVRVIAALGFAGVLASGALGGVTNAINGVVSPFYFRSVLGWEEVTEIWRACVAQGVFEGLLFGVAFSLIFTVCTGIITGAACSFRFAMRHLFGVLAGAFGCWILGGLAAVGLSSFSPEFYRETFPMTPQDFGSMIRFAWVGGSIWGVEFGGMVSVIVGLVLMRANWKYEGSRHNS